MYYHDDFNADDFTIIKNKNSDIPLSNQIKLSNDVPEQIEITWTYPQLRTLTKLVMQSEFIYVSNYIYITILRIDSNNNNS